MAEGHDGPRVGLQCPRDRKAYKTWHMQIQGTIERDGTPPCSVEPPALCVVLPPVPTEEITERVE